jgi:hypothetical protein
MGGRTHTRSLKPYGIHQARHVRAFFCAHGLPVKHAPARRPGTTRNVQRAVNRAAGPRTALPGRLDIAHLGNFSHDVDREPGARSPEPTEKIC